MKQFAPFYLLLFALLLAGCIRPSATSESAKTSGPKPILVKTVAAVQTEIARTTRQPATVHPFFETQVRPRVSGYVSDVSADIGDVVKAGDVLAKVDVPELDRQRETLVAQIDLLIAEEKGADAGVKLAEAAVLSARAKFEQAKSQQASVEASLAAAEAEFRRTEDLVSRGSLQSRVLDEVRKKRDSELASREAVLSAVTASEAEVGVATAEQAAAEARFEMSRSKTDVARRQLDELQVQLDFASVAAPFDGIVTQRHVNLGDLMEGGGGDNAKPLFVLSKVDRVRVQIPVPEGDAPFVRIGDAIRLTFPSFASESPIEATVTRRSGSLDPSTRTMTVEAEIENANGRLLPGMFGQATIELEAKVAATSLPSRAVRFDESGRAYVYLLDDEDRVTLADVTIGTDTGSDLEILSGIEAGDVVIGPHLKRFTQGQQVKPL
ncbi:MAG: efflux RND transporter periplasmic adaptor subunit [Planctomycetota bacterium]